MLAEAALIALIAFVAAIQPQHTGEKSSASTVVELTSESTRGATGLIDRPEGSGGGQAVDVDDDCTDTQAGDDWAQQQDEEQQEQEDEEEEQQEEQQQDEQNEEQAQESLQLAQQEIQQSEQEAEEQNEQAEQQALEDEQQAQLDEQQAGQ